MNKKVIYKEIEKKFKKSNIYFSPNINGDRPNILIIEKNKGVYLIEISSMKLSEYFSEDKVTFINQRNGIAKLSPLKKLKKYKSNLFSSHIEGLLYRTVKDSSAFGIVKNVVIFQYATAQTIKNFFGSNKVEYINLYGHNDFQRIPFLRENKFFTAMIYENFRKVLNNKLHKKEDGIDLNYTKRQKQLSMSKVGQYKIRGVAGAGKTYVLAKRAINSYIRHSGKVLILTYNKSLKKYIQHKLDEVQEDFDYSYFDINHFHAFITSMATNFSIAPSIVDSIIKDDIKLDSESLIFYKDKFPKYQAIFIDEVQDYETKWIRVIKEYFLDVDGEFVVFGDEKQNIYDRELDAKKKINTTIPGRWNDLKDSFRFNGNIIDLTNSFQENFLSEKYEVSKVEKRKLKQGSFDFGKDTEHIEYIPFDNDSTIKELAYAIHLKIKNDNLKLKDVSIVGSRTKFLQELDFILRNELGRKTQTIFETQEYINKYGRNKIKIDEIRDFKKNNFNIYEDAIKLSTIHSFKGYEAKTLFFLMTKDDIEDEVIYTAFTRAKENLYIINNGNEKYDEFFSKNVPTLKNIQQKLTEEIEVSLDKKTLNISVELEKDVKKLEEYLLEYKSKLAKTEREAKRLRIEKNTSKSKSNKEFELMKKQLEKTEKELQKESKKRALIEKEKEQLVKEKNELNRDNQLLMNKLKSSSLEAGQADKVLSYTRKIEFLLSKFGAKGRGIHTKLDSIKHQFEEPMLKKIRWIATLRNNLMHTDGFKIDDFDRFDEVCIDVISYLEWIGGESEK